MDNSHDPPQRSGWWKGVGLVFVLAWLAVLAYLLLAADPPDLWFNDIGTVAGPGHVVAGLVTGFVIYALVSHRRGAVRLAFGSTVLILVGFEVVQAGFTDRGTQSSDVTLSIVGAVLGVGAGWAAWSVAQRWRVNSPTRR